MIGGRESDADYGLIMGADRAQITRIGERRGRRGTRREKEKINQTIVGIGFLGYFSKFEGIHTKIVGKRGVWRWFLDLKIRILLIDHGPWSKA